jgi:hypothetical protein
MQKMRAENERLRDQHHQTERQNRQGAYHHQLLAVLNRIDMMATGFGDRPAIREAQAVNQCERQRR